MSRKFFFTHSLVSVFSVLLLVSLVFSLFVPSGRALADSDTPEDPTISDQTLDDSTMDESLELNVTAEAPSANIPRGQSLYFNGQQWGSVYCWNPYSSNCNNAMAIAEQDNARVTMFETPYIFNMMDNHVYPLLADGDFYWDAGQTKITFKIKTAAHWSDGTAVTANDVAYTWATHEKFNDNMYGTFSSAISDVVAVDNQTVEVDAVLEDGAAANPYLVESYLSTAYVIQKAWTQTLEARSEDNPDIFMNDPAEDVVYSGPYHKYFADDSVVILVRDDNYWGKGLSMWKGLPAPKYLAHTIYADNDAGLAAFKNGDVDVSQQFISNVQDLWEKDGLPISTYLSAAPYNIGASLPTAFYNLGSYGLDNVTIRKAIAIAVNYDEIIANAMSNQSATFAQVPRSLMNTSPGEQALYDSSDSTVQALQWAGNDIAGANKLLDDAGIVDTDADGYREYLGQKLQYTVACPNGWMDWMGAADLIAAAGQSIGIDITANFPEWDVYQTVVTNWPIASGYDIFIIWTDGAGPNQPWSRIHKLIGSEFAQTTNNWTGNWGGYINPAVDNLIREIPTLTDPSLIKADYTDLVKIYLTDVPSFTLMYRPQMFYTVNETVWTNYPHDGDGTDPIIPPTDLTDGYGIAGLYNLVSQVPGTFVKTSPTNGLTNVATSPMLSWGSSTDFDNYEYCVGTTNPCTNWVSTGTETSVRLSGLTPNTVYYWNVRAGNAHGYTYANDSVTNWTFRVGAAPALFQKTAPTSGITNQPNTVKISWGASARATAYYYCIDKTNDNACTTWKSNGTATSMTLTSLAPNTTYYWQVRAVNSYGTTYANGSSTSYWSFKTGTVPAAFVKSSPLKAAINQTTTITLKWAASSGATTYYYCIDKTNDNACSTWVNVGTATSKTISGLAGNTTYYWQVKAVNSFGTTYSNGSSTAFWYFKTGILPAAFNKSTPANGAINQPTSVTLKWGASSGAKGYYYCYDTTNDNSCTTWISAGTATSKLISGLKANTTYYWQVRAINSIGLTYANSNVWWSFKTK